MGDWFAHFLNDPKVYSIIIQMASENKKMLLESCKAKTPLKYCLKVALENTQTTNKKVDLQKKVTAQNFFLFYLAKFHDTLDEEKPDHSAEKLSRLAKFHDTLDEEKPDHSAEKLSRYSRELLKQVFQKAAGSNVENKDIQELTENFKDKLLEQLKQLEYEAAPKLWKYLDKKNILKKNVDNTVAFPMGLYILCSCTPHLGSELYETRQKAFKTLSKKIENGAVDSACRFQLIGEGGSGKSEIISKLYEAVKEGGVSSTFTHVAFVSYTGTLKNSLFNCVDYPVKTRHADNVWNYMCKLWDKKQYSILFLIDDKRPWKNEKGLRDQDMSEELRNIPSNVTVVLASPKRIDPFETISIDALSVDECVKIIKEHLCPKRDEEAKKKKKERDTSLQQFKCKNCKKCFLSVDEKNLKDELAKNERVRNVLVIKRFCAEVKNAKVKIPPKSINRLTIKLQKLNKKIKTTDRDTPVTNYNELKMHSRFNRLLLSKYGNLLEAFALLSGPFDRDTCVEWLHKDAGLSDDQCRDEMKDLCEKYELLMGHNKADVAGSHYFMHRRIKEEMFENRKIKFDDHEALVTNLSEAISLGLHDPLKVAKYMPHASAIARYFCRQSESTIELAILMVQIGRYYEAVANYNKALEWYRRVLTNFFEKELKEHSDTATIYSNIALIYNKQGKYDDALELYNKVLRICQKELGEDHPDIAALYNSMAEVYYYQGKYDDALGLYDKALAIFEIEPVVMNHPETTLDNNKVAVYLEEKRYYEALKEYKLALDSRKRTLFVENLSISAIYNNKADAYSRKGNYSNALKLYQKALDEREKSLVVEYRSASDIYEILEEICPESPSYDASGANKAALECDQKGRSAERDWMNCEEQRKMVESAWVDAEKKWLSAEHEWINYEDNDDIGLKKNKKLQKNVDYTSTHVKTLRKIALSLNDTALTKYKTALKEYGEADKYYDEACKIHKNILKKLKESDKKRSVLETVRSKLVNIRHRQRKVKTLANYAKALELYEDTLAVRKKGLIAEKCFEGILYNNKAGGYTRKGNYFKAEVWYKKALTVRKRVLGVEHPDTITTYNNLAGIYVRQGHYNKALVLYGRVLVIGEWVLGKDNLSFATACNNIAYVYYRQEYNKEKHGGAKKWYDEALKISKNKLGENHPYIATIYNNLAVVHDNRGEYAKALVGHVKALAIRENTLGKNHPDTADTYSNMAGAYYRQGNDAKALELYKQALDIREKILDVEHTDTADTYNNIAAIHANRREYHEALVGYEKALAIRENVLGKIRLDAILFNNMAEIYYHQGKYDKALKLYDAVLAKRVGLYKEGHPSAAVLYNNQASIYAMQKKYSVANEKYALALEIYKTTAFSGDNPYSSIVESNQAYIKYENGDSVYKAISSYENAFDKLKVKLGPDHPYTKTVLANLEKLNGYRRGS